MKKMCRIGLLFTCAMSLSACIILDAEQPVGYSRPSHRSRSTGFGNDVIVNFDGVRNHQSGSRSQMEQNSSFSIQRSDSHNGLYFDHQHREQHNRSRSESSFSW